ncbi:MAG: dihydroorotate dehydrogenase [Candidatus Buchananbacteria bacterium]
MSSPDLSTILAGIKFANPVMNASGTWDLSANEVLIDPKPGAYVSKTVKLEPVAGNKPPRLFDTNRYGILNAIGLAGVGIEAFQKEHLPHLLKMGRRVIVNISGTTVDEYTRLTELLDDTGIDLIEVNISCPNVKRGMSFGQDQDATLELVSAIRPKTQLPLIVKLTPNVTNIVQIALAAQAGGADILSLTNTLLGLHLDPETGNPVLANITGGLSGPALMPVALRCVWQVCHNREITIPVIGMGGITSLKDALEFLWAGASAVAVGTANFAHPSTAMPEIIADLSNWLTDHNHSSFEAFRNVVKQKIQEG